MRLLPIAFALLLASPALAQDRDVPGDESRGRAFMTDDPQLPVSAEAHGLAGAGFFDRGADPLRAFRNPALLADLDGLTLAGSSTPDYFAYEGIDVEGGAVAYQILQPSADRPLALVLGAATTQLDASSDGDADHGRNRVSLVALGAGWEAPTPLRAGLGVRWLTDAGAPNLSPASGEAPRSSAFALDLGADVTVPVSDWIRPAPARGPRLAFDLTTGIALRGLTVAGASTADPTRSLALGTSARLGLDVGNAERPLRAVEVAGLADLVSTEFDATLTYLGARVTVIEALALRFGTARFAGGYRPPGATGVGVSGGGLLRALGTLSGSPRLVGLGRRVDVRYDFATQPSGLPTTVSNPTPPDWQTHSLTLRVRP